MNPPSILVIILAAAASAGLFLGLATGTSTAVGFALISPLPIAIASLGWGSLAGFAAAILAPVALFFISGSAASPMTLAVAFTAPVAIAGHLIGLARPVHEAEASGDEDISGLEWYPLARVLLALAFSAALACLVLGWFLDFSQDAMMEAFRSSMIEANSELDPASQLAMEQAGRMLIGLIPLVQPAFLTLVLAICLYLGAFVARASGRMERPKDDIASATRMPKEGLTLFAAGIVASFVPGAVGTIGLVFVGAFGLALAIVGLARLHERTRGKPGRGFILFATYAACGFLTFPILIFVISGLIESWRAANRPYNPV